MFFRDPKLKLSGCNVLTLRFTYQQLRWKRQSFWVETVKSDLKDNLRSTA